MPTRTASAQWNGNLMKGDGEIEFGGGSFRGPYSFASRFEEGAGTNPEELLAAAHAGCFSQALSLALTEAGHEPTRISTTAHVSVERSGEGFAITKSHLVTEVQVPGLDESAFQKVAEEARKGCPVSKALAGVNISLDAKLV